MHAQAVGNASVAVFAENGNDQGEAFALFLTRIALL